jgi:adenylosuccinate synthase
MAVDVILGLQWGDEGKGKIVDAFANSYDVVARFQGGPNAGHTLWIDGKKFVLNTIPSGVFHDRPVNLIGNGVVIDPVTFQKESDNLERLGCDLRKKLFIARKSHLIIPTHRILDAASEKTKGELKIGSTLKGIGPCYMDKTGRNGLRVGDIALPDFKKKYTALKEKHLNLLKLYNFDFDVAQYEKEFFEGIEWLRQYQAVDGDYFLYEKLRNDKDILAEGAQGSMLDLDFGTYPYVTSSNTITAGACVGLGLSPKYIREVIGITKAYCTRVGSGPFPTEITGEEGDKLRKAGNEFGAVTGRPRRCGWLDIPALNYTIMLNGVTKLIITKADVLCNFTEFKVCTHYEYDGKNHSTVPFDLNATMVKPVYETIACWKDIDKNIKDEKTLPEKLRAYVKFLQTKSGVQVSHVSVGPDREQLITTNL